MPTLPAEFSVPVPSDDPALRDDEEPLEPEDLDLGLAPRDGAHRGINAAIRSIVAAAELMRPRRRLTAQFTLRRDGIAVVLVFAGPDA